MLIGSSRKITLGPSVPVLLLVLMVTACGGSAPVRHYYSLTYTLPQVAEIPTEGFKYPYIIRVANFEVALAYDRPQIVYRESPYKLEYYNYQLWTGRPQKLVRDLVVRHLSAVYLFQEVTKEYTRVPHYELEAEIEGIEEYDSGDVWFAHLAITFKLVEFESGKVVWVHSFDVQKKVFNKQPVYVVKSLSEIMEIEMEKMVIGLDVFFAKRDGVDPGIPWLDAEETETETDEDPWDDPWETY